MGHSFEEIIWDRFLTAPEASLFHWDAEKNKSFFHALNAIEQFFAVKDQVFSDWEIFTLPSGRPAVELGFYMTLPNGLCYRGFVDVVLKHKVTGEIRVIENKTNGAKYLVPSQYQNSFQAIGYSLVLDHLVPELSSYDVTYTIYSTSTLQWEVVDFNKSYQARARWLRELILDAKSVEDYERMNFWPTRGEHCVSYGRECTFLGVCHMEDSRLVTPVLQEEIPEEDMSKYDFIFSLEEVIDSQQRKLGALA